MIILIAGSTHTGKTALAQRLLERYQYPWLSLDHLKMGLIRSGQTTLTPMDDELLTDYLWPIAREMIKTAVENGQNLIVEGCYIPFNWRESFDERYLRQIRCLFLVMTERYIRSHWDAVTGRANVVEQRLDDELSMEELIADNTANAAGCAAHGCPVLWIDERYTPADLTAVEAALHEQMM